MLKEEDSRGNNTEFNNNKATRQYKYSKEVPESQKTILKSRKSYLVTKALYMLSKQNRYKRVYY